jgi:DNA-binding response OmpR family regulator
MAATNLSRFSEVHRARDRHCGVGRRVRLRAGLLSVMYDPLEIYAGAQKVAVSPLEAAILELLIRQGRASAEALHDLFAQEGGSIRTLDVLVHRIRRKFLDAGLFDPIETVRGWGLKLAHPPRPSLAAISERTALHP